MTDWVKAWCDDHPNFGLTKDILSLRKELASAKAENEQGKEFLEDIDRIVGVEGFRNEGDDEYLDTVNGVTGMVEVFKENIEELKAENGRLVEAITDYKNEWDNPVPSPAMRIILRNKLFELLSTSNALDYWQGEIRRAEDKLVEEIRGFIISLASSNPHKQGLYIDLHESLGKWWAKSRQSNQSKGEKAEGGV